MRIGKYLLAILLVILSISRVVYALPQGESVASGEAKFDRAQAGTLNIDISTDRAIIDYDSFSIAPPEAVHFYQPSSSSVALNRVTGLDPSSILGVLTANGRIFLVNPNGILFGAGCRVDTAGLVASTLNISNSGFLAGRYDFSGKGNIVNQGQIFVSPGGYAVLLGSTVENSGIIQADLSTVALACGEEITLNLDAQGLISVVIDKATADNLMNRDNAIKNTGVVAADGGKVILTAQVLDGVFKEAINNEGLIQANALVEKDGEIILQADQRVNISGEISAQGGVVRVDCQGADFSGNIKAAEGIFTMNDGDTEIAGGIYDGDMTWEDNENIEVSEDVTVNNGSITIIADADNDSEGDFEQSAGVLTTTSSTQGDIVISGGEVVTGEIDSAKTLSLSATGELETTDDLTAVGTLTITADSDGDNSGEYNQSGGTITTSAALGDITISGVEVTVMDIVCAADLDITASGSDIKLGSVSAQAITLTADEGEIIDNNADSSNVRADVLVISANNGIGDGDALETAVSNLQAVTSRADIEVSNTGDLFVVNADSEADSVDIRSSLDLTVRTVSAAGGMTLVSYGGAIIASGSGTHLTAGDDSLCQAATTIGSAGQAFNLALSGGEFTVTLSGELDADRGFFAGTTPGNTITVEDASSGVVYFNDEQVWPAIESDPSPDPTSDYPLDFPGNSAKISENAISHLIAAMTRKIERGHLELADSLKIVSLDQATPHFFASQPPLPIDSSALLQDLSVFPIDLPLFPMDSLVPPVGSSVGEDEQ